MDHARLYSTFLAIARTGAISRAARQLGCSTGAASRQLDTLEAHLGARLFDRSTRSVRLSAAGERLLPQAEVVLEALMNAQRSVDTARVQSSVRICSPIAIGVEWLSANLAEISQSYPLLKLELLLDNGVTDTLLEGVDIVIRSGLSAGELSPDLVVREVGSFEIGIYANPGVAEQLSSATEPEQLGGSQWLGHLNFKTEQIHKFERGGRVSTLVLAPRLWSSDILSITHMAQSGAGLALIPKWLTRVSCSAGKLVEILPEWRLPSLGVWLAWRNTGPNREAVSLVATQLQKLLKMQIQG